MNKIMNKIIHLCLLTTGVLSFFSSFVYMIHGDERWYSRFSLGFIILGINLIIEKLDEKNS